VQYSMKKDELHNIGVGIYQDERGFVYCDIQELLTFHNLPDKPEIRRALRDEIERQFRAEVTELPGE
jgi:hypothetical protein